MKAYEISQDRLSAVMTLAGPLDPAPEYNEDSEVLTVDDAHVDLIDTILGQQDIELQAARQRRLAALADRRWRAETGGIVVGGAVVRTDAQAQGKITGAVSLFQTDSELETIDWEAQPGIWITIDRPTMTAIGIAVGRHVQACFSNARSLTAAIVAAETVEAVEAVDFESGWP